MSDTQQRKYLDDVPEDIQDLIFENRFPEATQLLMDQRGLGKMQAAMEAARIATRMRKEFPEAVPAGPGLTAKQQSIVTWALISLFLVVGAVFTGFGIHGLALGFASRSWPSTEGHITQSKVERRTDTEPIGGERIRFSGPAYYAVVAYEFTVDGATYKADRVASADIGGGEAHARRIAERYPKGSDVRVYYMPENPSTCLLEPGFQGQAFIFPSIGLFVLLLGGVFLAAKISAMRDERKVAEQSPAGDGLTGRT